MSVNKKPELGAMQLMSLQEGDFTFEKLDLLPEITTSDFTVLVFGEITTETSRRVCRQILDCNLIDPERPIKIIINSGGGDVSAMWAMIGVMQSVSNPKITYAFGEAQSAAFVLLVSGDLRYCFENTLLMDHEEYTAMEGTFTQLTSQQKMLNISHEQFKKHYEECTGLSWERLQKTIFEVGKNIYLNPIEALELHCVDVIIKSKPRARKDFIETISKETLGAESEVIIAEGLFKGEKKVAESVKKRKKNV